VFIERADAGDAKKIFQFTQKALLIIADVINCRGSHGLTLSGKINWKTFGNRENVSSIPRQKE
jgi:hypothetical protein